MLTLQKDATLFEACQYFDDRLPVDFGGGAPFSKSFLTGFLVRERNLRSFVEIGVYRGRSFFPVAWSIHQNGGVSYGIDPYSCRDALEYDLAEDRAEQINSFLNSVDFESLYQEVLAEKEACGFGESIRILRETSLQAAEHFRRQDIWIDLLHIDGNHDRRFVECDYEQYAGRVREGGFIIFDDIDWPSVRGVYEKASQSLFPVYECEGFGILQKGPANVLGRRDAEKLRKRMAFVAQKMEEPLPFLHRRPIVAVGVLTYNHAEYVEQCLRSILSQSGEFDLKLTICDDCSTDATDERIRRVLADVTPSPRLQIEYIANEKNLGLVRSFEKLLHSLPPSDYFTVSDGDDYYSSSFRLDEHIRFHRRNPQAVTTFNSILIRDDIEQTFQLFQPRAQGERFSTEQIAGENISGNLSACFYDSAVRRFLPPDLFQVFCADWFFNLFVSQFGEVCRIPEPLSVYRRHTRGTWSGLPARQQAERLIRGIDEYNAYLGFSYDSELMEHRERALSLCEDSPIEQLDLIIVDDVFPHPLSGFRYQEYSSYLREIPRSCVFATGHSLSVLGRETYPELALLYKRHFPQFGSQLRPLHSFKHTSCKLLYGLFLGNAFHSLLPLAEQHRIPFAFTLYPGGGFGLHNEASDVLLRRVCDSEFFRHVIVTQKLVQDYLLEKRFCPPDRISLVRGVVTPLDKLRLDVSGKGRYGFEKDKLDICFTAHRYTATGEDKGYDVFLQVARMLSEKFSNVAFHVVGPYDEAVLDTSGIQRLQFYGTQPQDWFDQFYTGIDIILSPTTTSKIYPGNFDGFPTGCSVDAALRKVAMFCTDPLNLNEGRFASGREIEIVPHDAEAIALRIEHYYRNPQKLSDLAARGYLRAQELFSAEQQIAPRVEILRQLLR